MAEKKLNFPAFFSVEKTTRVPIPLIFALRHMPEQLLAYVIMIGYLGIVASKDRANKMGSLRTGLDVKVNE